jgi:hypothetical protein
MQHTHGDGVDFIFASLNTSCTLDIATTFVAQTNHFSSLPTTRNNTKPWNLVHTICHNSKTCFAHVSLRWQGHADLSLLASSDRLA